MKPIRTIAAAGLVATSLSFTAGPAAADETSSPSPTPTSSPTSSPTASPTAEPTEEPSGTPSAPPTSTGAFTGYSASGVATPIKIELFEPSIPIPTTPQGEFDLGYAKVKSNTAGTTGRASFLWPGDGVGEGLKTFFQQLGLPTALVEDGYPVQVNSRYPSDTTTDAQAPFPGTSMTTTSGEDKARATVGFSNNCNAGDGGPEGGGDEGGGGGGLPGVPELPGLPELPLLDNLSSLLAVAGLARTSAPSGSAKAGAGRAAADEEDEESTCQLPEALAALVDVNGYVADAQSVSDGSTVTSTSRAALGDVRLLGGLVTMSGVSTTLVSSSDGATGVAKGRADYGTMTIAGQTFGIGPEGYTAMGDAAPIPGLPDDPAAALAALGISIQLPDPIYKADGDKASGTVEGLIVTLDLKTLRPVLSQIDLGPLLAQIPFPPEAGPLKSLLGAIGNLSPRVVVHLGYTTAAVDTVQGIEVPDTVPDNDPTEEPTEEETGGTTTGGATGGGGTDLGGGALPPVDTSSGTPEATTAPVADAALASGLPKLFSIPGLLMALGLGGALLAGSYVRRIGAMVLGGAGACAHGLESGLPDLRKVQ